MDVGASDKDASYVVGEMRTKTTTSHPHRPSGPRPESATPTSPAAGEDAGPREPPCTAGGVQAVPRSGRGLGALDPTRPRRRARRPCAAASVCPEAERGRAQTFAAAFLVTAKTWRQPLGGRTEKRAVAHPTTEGHPGMKANELSGRQRTRRNGKRMSPGKEAGVNGPRAAWRRLCGAGDGDACTARGGTGGRGGRARGFPGPALPCGTATVGVWHPPSVHAAARAPPRVRPHANCGPRGDVSAQVAAPSRRPLCGASTWLWPEGSRENPAASRFRCESKAARGSTLCGRQQQTHHEANR